MIPRNGIAIHSFDTGYRATIGGNAMTTLDGRVLLFLAGPETFGVQANFPIIRTEMWESLDSGRTWEGPRILHQGNADSVFLPGPALRLASGQLLLIVGKYGGYDFATHDPDKSLFEYYTRTSSDNGQTWTPPVRMDATWRYMNSPLAILQLSSGRILIPSGYLTPFEGRSVVATIYSDDDGATWHRSPEIIDTGGAGFESGPSEPTAVELPDGRVWMLMRTQSGAQWESFSADGGVTWGPAGPSRFPSSSAPATLAKLDDGRIVVVWCNSVAAPYARHNLAIAISDDGGRSFSGYREIAHVAEPVPGLERRWGIAYAYPLQAPDGSLLVPFNTGDWKFMQLKIARIDPQWIAQPTLVETFADGLAGWCGVGARGESLVEPGDAEPGLALHINWVEPGPSGLTRNFPLLAQGRFRCEVTVFSGPAYLLWHDSFLDPGHFDDACVRLRFDSDGAVYAGTGTPETREIGQAKLSPEYSYTAYPVKNESKYPLTIEIGRGFQLTMRVDVTRRRAYVAVDDGPEITCELDSIVGLCYFAIATGSGGSVRLRRFETIDD